MGLSFQISVPAMTVFLQGMVSFFSPCVLSLAPLYISYLAGGLQTLGDQGAILANRRTVIVNTFFFVLGISFAFFTLGLGFTAAGRFFSGHRHLFAQVGGLLVILFGLGQMGFLRIWSSGKEHRLPIRMDRISVNPLTALVVGFTFSFAWTPCIGPILASVLLMASSSSSALLGFGLIGLYSLGFGLPFMVLGLFARTVLALFQRYQKVVRYTVKLGGALMILMGIMMLTGWMDALSSYLSSHDHSIPVASAQEASERPAVPAPDFELTDQFGQSHRLSDYKGKVVFLNFWATWCPPCRQEMPDIQALYEKHGKNSGDLMVLGVANPKSDQYPRSQDGTIQDVMAFLSDNGYSYPVAMDFSGEVFGAYGVRALPTTFMIDRKGNVFGYVPGALSEAMIESIVRQTMEGSGS